jgi:hypothetical protein
MDPAFSRHCYLIWHLAVVKYAEENVNVTTSMIREAKSKQQFETVVSSNLYVLFAQITKYKGPFCIPSRWINHIGSYRHQRQDSRHVKTCSE